MFRPDPIKITAMRCTAVIFMLRKKRDRYVDVCFFIRKKTGKKHREQDLVDAFADRVFHDNQAAVCAIDELFV